MFQEVSKKSEKSDLWF